MLFLHTSDWHLGATGGERELLEDQRFFIDEICRVVRERRVDAVLLAGDVYDRAVASASAIGLYDDAMDRLCRELGVPVLVIAGNHDGPERLASCGSLLDRAGLHVLGAAQREPKVVSFPEAEVFLLPWITEEKVKSLYPEEREKIQSLPDAYRVALDRMRERFTPGKKHIVLAHAFITDAETSTSDRAAVIGTAAQVPASVCLTDLTMWPWGTSTSPRMSMPMSATAAPPWPIPSARRSPRRKASRCWTRRPWRKKSCL